MRKIVTLFAALAVAFATLVAVPQAAQASTAWTADKSCAYPAGSYSYVSILIETWGTQKRLRQVRFTPNPNNAVDIVSATAWEAKNGVNKLRGAFNPWVVGGHPSAATSPLADMDFMTSGGRAATVILHQYLNDPPCAVTFTF